jgi:hypothetical protein
MRGLLCILIAAVAVSTAGCLASLDPSELAPLEEAPAIVRLTTAHRGSLHRGLPDNSIPALKEAIAAKVALLEVDVRRSDAGELFLFHDSRISFSNSVGACNFRLQRVASLSSAQRKKVFLNEEHSIAIPDLSEALIAIKDSGSRLQLDIKQESDDLVRAVIREVKKHGAEKDVVVQLRTASRIRLARSDAKTKSSWVRPLRPKQILLNLRGGYLELLLMQPMLQERQCFLILPTLALIPRTLTATSALVASTSS